MDKPVRAVQMPDQIQTNGLPEIQKDLLVRFPENNREYRDLGDVAEAGKLLQRDLSLDRKAGQLRDHKVYHIVGVSLGVKTSEFPVPACGVMIEAEKTLFYERRNKLDGEKRIAARLLVH